MNHHFTLVVGQRQGRTDPLKSAHSVKEHAHAGDALIVGIAHNKADVWAKSPRVALDAITADQRLKRGGYASGGAPVERKRWLAVGLERLGDR